jgi:hypothetical protein
MKAGSAPTDPSDNVAYTASSNMSSPGTNINSDGSYVVFNGVGTFLTMSNLNPGTQYYFSVYAKNCFGANIKILTGSPATGNQFTLSLEPAAQPASLVASSGACNQITLTFPAASTITNAAGYLIIQRAGAAPTGLPTDASGYIVGATFGDGQVAAVLINTSTTTTNINGLSGSGTQYHFAIIPFGYNGSNSPTYNYFTGGTIRRANAAIPCANYYVNDVYTAGTDVYTTAAGNDANSGTSAATPKATVTNLLSSYKLTGKDTVFIDNGNYTETFTIDGVNADVNLIDEGTLIAASPFSANYLVFKGAGSAKTIFTTSSQTYNVFVNRAKYVWLEGISFINTRANAGTQNILREYGESGVVKNCALTINNSSANASYNIYLRCNKKSSLDTKRSLITSNTITNDNSSGIGIYVLGDVDFSRFEKNNITMTGTSGKGLLFLYDAGSDEDLNGAARYWPVSDTIFQNIIISNANGIECNTIAGYELYDYLIDGNRITVNNNTTSSQSCVWLNACGISNNDDFKIIRNRFMSAYAGVYMNSGVEFTTVSNNYFCTRFGLFHSVCDGSNSHNNFIHNSVYTSASCLYFDNQCQDWWDIRNNILYTTANTTASSCINLVTHGGTDVYITNGNMFYVPNGAAIASASGAVYSTLPAWQAAVADVSYISTNDPNSVSGVAPNFFNLSSCNLDLKQDSYWPAGYPNNASIIPGTSISLGGGTGTVSGDIKGISRTGWTIGAFDAASQGVLPVNLLVFNARLNSQRVLLDWQTASEQNADYFNVEKSKDGQSGWSFVSRVQSRGNSNIRADYQSIDHRPYGGTSYYRLKQVDQDGRIAYSQTRNIINDSKTISVYPNPATDHVIVEGLDKNRSNMIHLLDITGKLLSERFVKDSQYRFDLTKLPPGVYHVVVNGSEHFQLVKR